MNKIKSSKMKKLPDLLSDVFTSVVLDSVTVESGGSEVVKLFMSPDVPFNMVVVVSSIDVETRAVLVSVLVIMVVASFSTARTSKAPALYQRKVRS